MLNVDVFYLSIKPLKVKFVTKVSYLKSSVGIVLDSVTHSNCYICPLSRNNLNKVMCLQLKLNVLVYG